MTALPVSQFPGLTREQLERFDHMARLYREWNERINVISRKDIAQFEVHHLLHSLAIARYIRFVPGTEVMDAGTGGGFPGIPLAVMFPGTRFTLVDSIGKKIKVIEAVVNELKLDNVVPVNGRFEAVRETFDFVTGRAVSNLPLFVSMVKGRIRKTGSNVLPNGILYLTGGDVEPDLAGIRAASSVWDLSETFTEAYFQTKKLVHIHHFAQ